MTNMDFTKFGDFENRFKTLYTETAILNGCIVSTTEKGLTKEKAEMIRARLNTIKGIIDNMENF